jgi:TRAP-type C4-dicarboxylate transport system permease large subunit
MKKMGTFMEQVSMMMITIPIYMPVLEGLGYDPIWFAVLMLLDLEMAMSTPLPLRCFCLS